MTIKKVLFQLNQLGYGGTEKAILSFAEHLDRNQYDIYLFYWDDRSSLKFFRLLFLSPFFSSVRKKFRILYEQRFARELQFQKVFGPDHHFQGKLADFKRAIDKINPDIIHLNRGVEKDFYTDYITNLDRKIQVVESNIFGKESSEAYTQRVRKFFFVSHWLKDLSSWAQGKAEVLYNPILPPKTTQDLRAELGISKKAIVLGRAHRPDMGQDEFLEQIYDRLPEDSGQEIIFLCLGSEPDYSEKFKHKYREQIKTLLPTTDEKKISQFYNTIDILTHRRVEGESFGMIIAEAMIHGRPVLSHRSPVDNAQIEVLGDASLISDFEDKKTYRDRLLDLIKNQAKRESLGRQLQARAMDLFSVEKSTRVLERHYASVVND